MAKGDQCSTLDKEIAELYLKAKEDKKIYDRDVAHRARYLEARASADQGNHSKAVEICFELIEEDLSLFMLVLVYHQIAVSDATRTFRENADLLDVSSDILARYREEQKSEYEAEMDHITNSEQVLKDTIEHTRVKEMKNAALEITQRLGLPNGESKKLMGDRARLEKIRSDAQALEGLAAFLLNPEVPIEGQGLGDKGDEDIDKSTIKGAFTDTAVKQEEESTEDKESLETAPDDDPEEWKRARENIAAAMERSKRRRENAGRKRSS